MHGAPQVHCVHGDLDLADYIMLRETVKVVDLQYQRLPTQLRIGDLRGRRKQRRDCQSVSMQQ